MPVTASTEEGASPLALTDDERNALVYARDLALSVLTASPGYVAGEANSDIAAIRSAVDKTLERESR